MLKVIVFRQRFAEMTSGYMCSAREKTNSEIKIFVNSQLFLNKKVDYKLSF